MAIGLTRSKNLSESNLNLKTALQKLYAPGIENDIELFSLSSSVESITFSGLFSDDEIQIYRLTTERLRTLSGDIIKRTKFSTRGYTFTDENKVYFTKYEPGIGNAEDAEGPRLSVSGSIPAVELITGGGGFYFLDSQDNVAQLENFSGTWSASASSTVTITLSNHGFEEGQGLYIRFNNGGQTGVTNATSGEYVVQQVLTQNTFTIINSGGSITGSGNAGISSSDVRLTGIQLKGKTSGRVNARADVTFGKMNLETLPGTAATYSNTSFSSDLGSTVSTTITLSSHGLTTGDSVYIRVISGTLRSGFVSSVEVVNTNSFKVVLPATSANTNQNCFVCPTEELERFTPDTVSRYFVKSVRITDAGTNYVIPEELEIIESNVNNENTGAVIKLRKQRGTLFEGMPEIIRTKVFTYTVKNATNDGFFLVNDETGQYLFVDKNTPGAGLTASQKIEMRRFDGISVNNILQFKFAQSVIYLRGYSSGSSITLGGSVASVVNGISSTVNSLKLRSRAAIQNTKRPTPATSEENILGYTYNSFSGRDVVIWQRTILRDQDFVLDPSDSTLGTGAISGDRLRSAVDRFVLGPLVSWSCDTSGVATISLANHPVETGDNVVVNNIVANTGSAFTAGTYSATKINSSSFSISIGVSTASTGTLNLILNDQDFQIRVPGLFIKVGNDYRRAFSTTDKPFFQAITDSGATAAIANPRLTGNGASFTGQSFGALSAEGTLDDSNPAVTDWYSYNTTISELAQRIHTNGRDGAFYFHKQTAPTVSNITVSKGGSSATIYAVPLFTLAS